MYKPSRNKNTEKGATFLLLEKRNQQFKSLFLKLRDPITILQFYEKLNKVYLEHFGDERKASDFLKVLTMISDKTHFWQSDLTEKMGFTTQQADSILKRMGKRHLLNIDKSRNLYMYSLSADGVLFLRNFTKDCTTAMMEVVRNGRTGKKKVYSTIKKKK